MAPPVKTLEKYEAEATREESGCLVHPSHGAARKVFFMRHPETPRYLLVCHTCDNPKCIEDTHHFAGTSHENVMDSVQKGRHSCFINGEAARAASPFGTPEFEASEGRRLGIEKSIKRRYG